MDPKQQFEAFREMDIAEADLMLIRLILGLSPIHDTVEAVRLLYEQGREAFEAKRGPAQNAAETLKQT